MAGIDAGGGPGFMVNEDNVLQIGKAFRTEAARLAKRVDEHSQRMITVPALGDPASRDFADGLNAKLVRNADSYISRAREYVTELEKAADQCKAAALAYGYTEDEISAGFSGTGGGLV
jgi:hypothetical protein